MVLYGCHRNHLLEGVEGKIRPLDRLDGPVSAREAPYHPGDATVEVEALVAAGHEAQVQVPGELIGDGVEIAIVLEVAQQALMIAGMIEEAVGTDTAVEAEVEPVAIAAGRGPLRIQARGSIVIARAHVLVGKTDVTETTRRIEAEIEDILTVGLPVNPLSWSKIKSC